MICDDPRCTGHHDRNHWETMCPAGKEAGFTGERRRYEARPWRECYAKQLKTRRLRAVQRIEARRLSE